MRADRRILASCMATLALASGCAQQRGGEPRVPLSEWARDLPAVGDPGKVAATDIAFAKSAREDGQWTAFRRYAADDAKRIEDGHIVAAQEWLSGRSDPPQAITWTPSEVWSSCDGTLAVSFGRWQQPSGLVGDYATVWRLQRDRTYRWIFDTGTPDDPQPPPRAPQEEPDEDAIIVPGLAAIEGRVADCPGDGETFAPPVAAVPAGVAVDTASAADNSLRYRLEHAPDGSHRVVVTWRREGAWQDALSFAVPAPRAGG
ncbi:hypothetical protein [Aurantiacibacter spongiae]|uniref:Lipoprotein n=1 Tax=Aurantiacibacter spongiae TaxID=2488860 RepID=A0A3N5DIY9_9SPHN|nr:hypothetical protein [Aurantiacibacter spongiae]RPF71632.1 hypothetical protein EG799_08360 [Aurantiacibacter spongiae]